MLSIGKTTLGLVLCIAPSMVFATGPVRSQVSSSTITGVEIRGNRRIPTDRIRSELQTTSREAIDVTAVSRDIRSIYSMGYFDDVQFDIETRGNDAVVVFSVKEKPIVRTIEYKGIHSATTAEIEQTLAEAKKGLTAETTYSLEKAMETADVVKALLATKGHPQAVVGIDMQPVRPNAVRVVFVVDEGN